MNTSTSLTEYSSQPLTIVLNFLRVPSKIISTSNQHEVAWKVMPTFQKQWILDICCLFRGFGYKLLLIIVLKKAKE